MTQDTIFIKARDTIFIKVTGQEIIDAVEAIAQEPRVVKNYIDGIYVYIVGQQSEYPDKHLIITADGNHNINPAETYNAVTVMEHKWSGGMVYAVGYDRDDVINAIIEFTKKLKQQLETAGGEDGSTNG